MNTLVIYDSVFGNTEKIAQAIAATLGTQAIRVSQADAGQLRGLNLLVVGSPTRGFRPIEGVAKFLNGLPRNHLAGMHVAAFDTRIALETIHSKALRFLVDRGGYAAPKIARTLKKIGGKLVSPPEGFFVLDTEGPLLAAEIERAESWANELAGQCKENQNG
jgi:flavodoxin